jgi:hypothetical protein
VKAEQRQCNSRIWILHLALASTLFWSATASAALPDLIINRQLTASTISFERRNITADSCAFIEGCAVVGNRKLLRFAIGFANIGKGDLVIGNPRDHPELFTYSPCHGHYHFEGAAKYSLLNSRGLVVRTSAKQAFCLLDFTKYASFGRKTKHYTCDNQGISAGWQDIYRQDLDCQWLDVTGLKPGNYTLRLKVNPLRNFRESNYGNNTANVPVTIR